ncbi:hypothetical protein E4U26_005312 [Claviceps purpurea]|nr:hypothetical protein E4U26_005312 [Claviceps purpurea]
MEWLRFTIPSKVNDVDYRIMLAQASSPNIHNALPFFPSFDLVNLPQICNLTGPAMSTPRRIAIIGGGASGMVRNHVSCPYKASAPCFNPLIISHSRVLPR